MFRIDSQYRWLLLSKWFVKMRLAFVRQQADQNGGSRESPPDAPAFSQGHVQNMSEISNASDPPSVEDKWYDSSLKQGCFIVGAKSAKPSYCIVILLPAVFQLGQTGSYP
jgi:hypothetical protein